MPKHNDEDIEEIVVSFWENAERRDTALVKRLHGWWPDGGLTIYAAISDFLRAEETLMHEKALRGKSSILFTLSSNCDIKVYVL